MRYFFHTADGSGDRDEVGLELDNLNAARRQAIAYAGECMHFDAEILSEHDFRVEVTDNDDLLLFTVIAIAVTAPAAGHKTR